MVPSIAFYSKHEAENDLLYFLSVTEQMNDQSVFNGSLL